MKILKSIILILLFCITFILFLPKQNLYFKAEQELQKYDVIISNEIFISKLFGFELKDAELYVKGVNIAKLNKVSLSLDGFYIFSKEIGKAIAKVDINNKRVVVDFEPTSGFVRKYRAVLKYFKRVKRGKYRYEYKLY